MNIKNNRTEELKEKITDLEDSLAELKDQLSEKEKKAQHDAIDNLELYLQKIDNKYSNLRNFWSIIVDELKELFDGHSDKKK